MYSVFFAHIEYTACFSAHVTRLINSVTMSSAGCLYCNMQYSMCIKTAVYNVICNIPYVLKHHADTSCLLHGVAQE